MTKNEVQRRRWTFYEAVKLLYADFAHLLKIRFTLQSFSDPILHQGGHAVFDRLESQLLHLSPVLNEHFHLIRPGN